MHIKQGVSKEFLNVFLLEARCIVAGSHSDELAHTSGFIAFEQDLEALELVRVLPMSRVELVIAFEHLVVRQTHAVVAGASRLDGPEEGLAILVLLLDELGVVVELVEGRGNGQECRIGELEHGHDGLVEEIQGDVRRLIDDDDVAARATGRLSKEKGCE